MPAHRKMLRISTVLLAAVSTLGGVAAAQQRPAPKVEIFGGYSYFHPHAAITGTLPGAIAPVGGCLCMIPAGAGLAMTYDFNRWLGLTADASGDWEPQGSTPADKLVRSNFFTLSGGPKLTYRSRHIVPFGEALVGMQRLSPQMFAPDNAFGVLAGAGVDINVGSHLAIRAVQADYAFSNHRFGIDTNVPETNIRGLRVQAGVVFLFGGHAPRTRAMSAPIAAIPAETVAASPVIAAPVNLAPTLQCSANPSVMVAGESSTINVVGISPQHQTLSYSFTSNAGVLSGSGSTAMLSTAGVSAGTVLVNCTVATEAGMSATQTVPVTLTPAPLPVIAKASALCSISFMRDARRPTRVDNEAKACLDDIALNLQRNSDATLILIGNAAGSEQPRVTLAAQRAVNTKAYIVGEKGIDSSRIMVYTGSQNERVLAAILVPAGATPDLAGNTVVNENAVKGQPRNRAVHGRSPSLRR